MQNRRLQVEFEALRNHALPVAGLKASAPLQETKGPRLLVANPNWVNLPGPLKANGYYFGVSNDEHKRTTAAHDVKVALRLRHIDGETGKSVELKRK